MGFKLFGSDSSSATSARSDVRTSTVTKTNISGIAPGITDLLSKISDTSAAQVAVGQNLVIAALAARPQAIQPIQQSNSGSASMATWITIIGGALGIWWYLRHK